MVAADVARATDGIGHGMGDPVAADPGVCALRRGPGGRLASRDEPAVAGRPAAFVVGMFCYFLKQRQLLKL